MAIASVALIASACSSSSKGGGTAGSSTTSGNGNTSGTPVRIEVTGVNSNIQDLLDGARAAVKAVNDKGGIKGHPLEISTCNFPITALTQSDQCVRGAISDPTNLAFVASNGNAFDVDALETQAQMVSVGGFLGFGPDFTSASTLPVQGGSLVQNIAQALTCIRLGAKKIAFPYLDNPPSAASIASIKKYVLAPAGITNSIFIPIPQTATDTSPEATAASSGDCVAILAQGTQATTVVQDLLKDGYTSKPIIVGGAVYGAQSISQNFGASVSNIYTANMANVGSAGYKQFVSEVKAYDSSIVSRLNDFSAQGWLSVHMFADVANAVPGSAIPTRAQICAGAHKLTAYNTNGLTVAPIDYSVKGTALGGSIPNLYPSVTGMWVNKYTGGQLKPVGDNKPLPIPS